MFRYALPQQSQPRAEAMGQDQQQFSDGEDVTPPVGVLHRKAQTGRAVHQARAMTLAKALRLTLAKVADDLFDMAMAVIGLRSETRSAETLGEVFQAGTLLLLLEGPHRQRGGVVVDPVLVGALLQQQTMGKVLPAPEGDIRPMTETDAAMCAPFIDALIDRAANLPETDADRQLIRGYSFGARTETPRLLLMALTAQRYEIIEITIDIDGGIRQGMLTLCLPHLDAAQDPSDANGAQDDDTESAKPSPKKLAQTVLGLRVDLNIALTRFRLPLRRLGALKVGDQIDLGRCAFDQARVLTMGGKALGLGTLGRVNGMRALRVTQTGQGQNQSEPDGDARAAVGLPPAAAMMDMPGADYDAPDPLEMVDDLPDLPELPDLPDLPDMSDLPGFEGIPAEQEAG